MSTAAPTIAPFEYAFTVPHDARVVGVARTVLRAVLNAHGLPELLDRALLLVSEMLTNAYRHSTGEAQLLLHWAPDIFRMTVWDTSPKPPDLREPRDDSEGGRGLYLLSLVADRWAHYPLPPSSTAP
jgi:anti-sigma regulatory factor (Ser/Thr protein kinase)